MSDAPSARVATPELVRQLVREVRDQVAGHRHPEPLVIGARARPVWDPAAAAGIDGGTISVAACPTPLAARRALADFAGQTPSPDQTLVLLTDLPEAELGTDVLARFVRPRLLALSPWNAVCQRFGVRQLDPAFSDARYAWMADALLDVPLTDGRLGLGTLSVEAGLRALARGVLGSTDITLERILIATAQPDFSARVSHAEPRVVEQLCATLADTLGPAAALALGAVRTGHGEQAIPAGLAARCVVGRVTGSFAQAKIEALTGGVEVSDAALGAWARSAENAFEELAGTEHSHAPEVAIAGSALVRAWQAPHPEASDQLSAGFEARLELLAHRLDAALDPAQPADPDALRRAVDAVRRHRDASTEFGRARAQRALLAARLASWLRDPVSARYGTGSPNGPVRDEPTPTLTAAIDAYVADGAWVDAARRRVGEGDDTPAAFADVLRRISHAAHERRATGNQAFADTLARWSRHGSAAALTGSGVTAVESILEQVAVPLARRQPALLIVLDGCGLAGFLEFAEQFRSLGYREIGNGGRRAHGLAVLPTITAVSRTSLLSGTLADGTADDERHALPAHPAVAALPGPPAAIFHHRPDLVSGVGESLPEPVRAAIGADGPRLVAAVVNTIDDELSHGTFNPEYRIEHLGPLLALVRLAASVGRLVIITADHGHVLGVGLDGKGAVERGGDGGDRWRIADHPASADEVHLVGPRVLRGGDLGVLAPWHDDLRYSAKHGGYHGGATPDECIVPLSVFAPIGHPDPEGWAPVAVATPAWWDLHVEAAEAAAAEGTGAPTPAKRTRRATAPADHPALFGESEGRAAPAPPTPGGTGTPGGPGGPRGTGRPAWIDRLLASETYRLQYDALRRGKPDEARVRDTLAVLDARGGVAGFGVIAQATAMPVARVQGFLPTLARVLNVEGYPVLTIDQSAQEARLDTALLAAQFLGAGS